MTEPYLATTLPDELPADPLHWAGAWLEAATTQAVRRNPNSMTLSTVGADHTPSSRIVLCKAFVPDPGYLVFYTNYQSRKSLELQANPVVAVNFHWDEIGRQVRLQGVAVHSPVDESDRYFASRDWGSQVGAWGSDQSRTIGSRTALKEQIRLRAEQFGVQLSSDLQSYTQANKPSIPRPPHWGGIRVWPRQVELWIEGADRIHDRACWTRQLTAADPYSFQTGPWAGSRLQP